MTAVFKVKLPSYKVKYNSLNRPQDILTLYGMQKSEN